MTCWFSCHSVCSLFYTNLWLNLKLVQGRKHNETQTATDLHANRAVQKREQTHTQIHKDPETQTNKQNTTKQKQMRWPHKHLDKKGGTLSNTACKLVLLFHNVKRENEFDPRSHFHDHSHTQECNARDHLDPWTWPDACQKEEDSQRAENGRNKEEREAKKVEAVARGKQGEGKSTERGNHVKQGESKSIIANRKSTAERRKRKEEWESEKGGNSSKSKTRRTKQEQRKQIKVRPDEREQQGHGIHWQCMQ